MKCGFRFLGQILLHCAESPVLTTTCWWQPQVDFHFSDPCPSCAITEALLISQIRPFVIPKFLQRFFEFTFLPAPTFILPPARLRSPVKMLGK